MYEKLVGSPADGSTNLPTEKLIHTGRLVPVYPETEGISSKYLRLLIKKALNKKPIMPDPLPKELRLKFNFPELDKALKMIHFPEDLSQAQNAKNRFAFEDILLFQLRALRDRRQLQTFRAPRITFDKELIGSFVKALPFELTGDQRLATYEILKDLEKDFPMNRLLNGDVGSGKTVVALIAACQTIDADYQTVFMAPTEILAKQHFQTITSLISNFLPASQLNKSQISKKIKVGLLTSSEAKQWPVDETENEKIGKKLMLKKIADGEVGLVIGTHAVIQKNVRFKNLGLVVIDEQHRFGVEQRMKLIKNQLLVPHLLSMTATPIPRTLALTIYGDLDISLLKEKPKGRQEIITRVIPHQKRQAAYKFISNEIGKGRQAFVICPRIEIAGKETNVQSPVFPGPISQAKLIWSEVKAVTEEYEKLSKQVFPDLKVAMLHGKLKSKEKDEIMSKFKNGHHNLIVSTSVVEVGVDIPNATIMMIESAERFGLAQLHQFRGRVGRGEHQSYCLLFASDGRETHRLKAMEKTNDGFELAETDLKLRGPGEFTGVKQSGMPDLAMTSLSDIELIKKARLEAKLLIKSDPSLKSHPVLLGRLSEMQRMVHFE
jgi:ATP-dependent DNA helicase RecG